MSPSERWWRVTRRGDGHVTWTDEDPSDRLVAAWEGAKVKGPFIPEPPQAAVEAERHRNAALVRALAANSWEPSIEATLYEVARQIAASGER
jgi:hypothetical protein